MSGCRNGLNKKIKQHAKKAVFVHCYAHQLNLSLQNSCNEIKKVRNVLDTLNSLHEFIEASSKIHAKFQTIQGKNGQTLKHLSDTRWASRSGALSAMRNTFKYTV